MNTSDGNNNENNGGQAVSEQNECSELRQTEIRSTMFAMLEKFNPEASIADKIQPEHIAKMLDNQIEQSKLTMNDGQNKRIMGVIYFVVAALFIVALILLLKDNPDLLERVLTLFVGFALGAAGGFGLGKYKNNKDDDQ